ncbi:MAG: hypothetical protein M3N13_07375, partial [Candidatus Eremiobacteraeota bacterium]|nr:hypothetical protein [Candidatus Eremiobacteraeota bacterium]
MMVDFYALAYLELRQGRNFIRRLVTQPGRLAMYAVVAVYFGVMMYVRTQSRALGTHAGVPEPLASAIGFGALAFTASGFMAAAFGRVAAFSSLADARFLIGSK